MAITAEVHMSGALWESRETVRKPTVDLAHGILWRALPYLA